MRKLFTSSFSPNDRLALTRHCAEHMLAGQSFLYLVPSRESMFEVRSMLMDAAGGLFNGHVWGFDDLVRAVMKGHFNLEDVQGRHESNVLVQSVLRNMPNPRPYNGVLEKPGFIQGLCRTIADLKRAGVTAASLRVMLPDSDAVSRDEVQQKTPSQNALSSDGTPISGSFHNGESAKEKLCFLANVFSSYQIRMEEHGWLDTEDLSLLAPNHVSTAECLSGNTLLVVDGFQRLDAARLALLKAITHAWPDMDMMANVPYWDSHRQRKPIFENIPYIDPHQPDVIRDGIIADLMGLGFRHSESAAGMTGLSAATSKLKTDAFDSNTDAIKSTTDAFDSKASMSESSHSRFKPDISSMAGHPCRDHELRETARSITRLLSEHGVAPQQIAVFCPDAESYRIQLNEVFAEMGIPLDSQRPVPLHGIPIIRDLMALFLLRIDGQYGASMKNLAASKYLIPLPMLETMGHETDRLLQAAVQCDVLPDPEQWDNRFKTELKKIGLFQTAMQGWLDSLRSFHPEKTGNPSSAVHALLEQLKRFDPEAHIASMARQGILSAELLLRDMKALSTFRVFLEKTAAVWDRLIDEGADWHPQSAGDGQDTDRYPRSTADGQDTDWYPRSTADGQDTDRYPRSAGDGQDTDRYPRSAGDGQDTDWYPLMVRDLQALLGVTDIGYHSTDHAGVRFLTPEMAGGQSYHTAYLIGMNEGVFPRPVSTSILFTERESAILRRSGIPLADPDTERLHGQVLSQAVLSTARNGLHLSWCTASEDGALMNASPYVDDVSDRISAELLSTLRSKPVSMRDRVAAMSRVQSGFPLIARDMEMEREYSRHRGSFDGQLENPLLAQQETGFSFSPTQLNSYAYCPFTYFSERVLGLAEEDDEPLNAMNIGKFYHEVLRAYHERTLNVSPIASLNASSSMSSSMSPNMSFSTSNNPSGYPAEKFDGERLESIFEDLVGKLDFSRLPPLVAMFRKLTLLETLARFLQLDAANLSRFQQATGNHLIPVLLEQPFELSFGEGIRLKGIVDRIDLEVGGNHQFTGRHILYDYKKKNLKELKDIVMGEDFQLPLYRTALQPMLMERFGLKKPECLALLYFSIERQEWKGIVRSDVKNALFEPRKRPQVLTKVNMDVLLKWVEDEATGVVSRIRDGDFRLPLTCPANARQYDCRYAAICRHDEVRMARKSGLMAKLEGK